MTFETPFTYVHRQAANPQGTRQHPLLLLHGTGGNEHDMLGLADTVAPGRSLLAPRGRVVENGNNRYFRRFAEGQFDEDDIRLRAAELATFVTAACAHHGLSAPIALGYSNGANIAAALLTLYPGLLMGAILLRAMAPFRDMPSFTLPGTAVLLLSGAQDPMIPLADANRLASTLTTAGAKVTQATLPTGHGLVQTDLTHIVRFLTDLEQPT